jgi:hypothetical protein
MSLQDKISARFGELQKQVDELSPHSNAMDTPTRMAVPGFRQRLIDARIAGRCRLSG